MIVLGSSLFARNKYSLFNVGAILVTNSGVCVVIEKLM